MARYLRLGTRPRVESLLGRIAPTGGETLAARARTRPRRGRPEASARRHMPASNGSMPRGLEVGDQVAERFGDPEAPFAGDERVDFASDRGQELGAMAVVCRPLLNEIDAISRIEAEGIGRRLERNVAQLAGGLEVDAQQPVHGVAAVSFSSTPTVPPPH